MKKLNTCVSVIINNIHYNMFTAHSLIMSELVNRRDKNIYIYRYINFTECVFHLYVRNLQTQKDSKTLEKFFVIFSYIVKYILYYLYTHILLLYEL